MKDTLKADSVGDWANAINDEDAERLHDDNVPVKDTKDGIGQEPSHEYDGEEEKEEVTAIVAERIDSNLPTEGVEEQASPPSVS